MNHSENNEENPPIELSANIFKGSIALLSVCITVISLFQISNNRVNYLVDEVLCVSSALFTIAMLLSYLFIRKGKNLNYKKASDFIFTIGLGSMFIAGVFLVMQL